MSGASLKLGQHFLVKVQNATARMKARKPAQVYSSFDSQRPGFTNCTIDQVRVTTGILYSLEAINNYFLGDLLKEGC